METPNKSEHDEETSFIISSFCSRKTGNHLSEKIAKRNIYLKIIREKKDTFLQEQEEFLLSRNGLPLHDGRRYVLGYLGYTNN